MTLKSYANVYKKRRVFLLSYSRCTSWTFEGCVCVRVHVWYVRERAVRHAARACRVARAVPGARPPFHSPGRRERGCAPAARRPPRPAAPVRADIILYRINICTCGTRFRNKSRRVCSQHTLATHPCTRALLLVLSGRQSSCRTNGWRRSARPRRSPRRGGALEGGPEGAS